MRNLSPFRSSSISNTQPEETEPILPSPSESPVIPAPENQEDSTIIPVTKIEVTNSTIFTEEELQVIDMSSR